MTDMMGSFLPTVGDLPQQRSPEPTYPSIDTTTTTVPRFAPGDPALSPDRSTTVPPTSAPMQPDLPPPSNEELQRQANAVLADTSNPDLSDVRVNPNYIYRMVPLGMEPAATRRTRTTQETISGQTFNIETQEFFLDPTAIRNIALQNFDRQMSQIAGSIVSRRGMAPTIGGLSRRNFIDIDQGEKYTTEIDVHRFLNDMNVNELNQFKNRLVDLNLIRSDQRGSMDIKDINNDVYKAALRLGEAANENGIKYKPFIDFAVANGVTFSEPKVDTGRTIPPVRLSSPDDIRFTANQVAMRRLGREMTEPEQDAFIASYNQLERDFHRRAYGGGGEIVDTPAIQTAADAAVTSGGFRDEAELYATGEVLDDFVRILGGQR